MRKIGIALTNTKKGEIGKIRIGRIKNKKRCNHSWRNLTGTLGEDIEIFKFYCIRCLSIKPKLWQVK